MPDRRTTVLVGDRNVLSTVRPAPTDEDRFELVPRGADRDSEALATAVASSQPDAVVIFNPRPGEGEALARAGLPVAAWLTRPSPAPADRADLTPFTLLIATDPQTAERAGAEKWMLMARPVSDDIFIESPTFGIIERAFFDGAASERRDRFLQPVKHQFDVLHLVSGANHAQLVELLSRCQIAIDLAGEANIPARDRVGPALAAGLLVLAESPFEQPGLIGREHLLTFSNPDELELLISDALAEPESFSQIRSAGRAAAEQRRSSVVLPRLVDELLASA